VLALAAGLTYYLDRTVRQVAIRNNRTVFRSTSTVRFARCSHNRVPKNARKSGSLAHNASFGGPANLPGKRAPSKPGEKP
jgi:hypothetical protein